MPLIKATRPSNEQPVPAKEVHECPECRHKSNVRVLGSWHGIRRYYCAGCFLEFDSRGNTYQEKESRKAPSEEKHQPKSREKRFTTGKRFNREWTVSRAEKVIGMFMELKGQGTDPLVAILEIAEKVDRDPDEVLILVLDVGGTDWKIQQDREPKKLKTAIRNNLGR